MDDAVVLFQKLLKDNNLSVILTKPKVRNLEDGGLLIEQPSLQVAFLPKEVSNEPSTKKVAGKTPKPNESK